MWQAGWSNCCDSIVPLSQIKKSMFMPLLFCTNSFWAFMSFFVSKPLVGWVAKKEVESSKPSSWAIIFFGSGLTDIFMGWTQRMSFNSFREKKSRKFGFSRGLRAREVNTLLKVVTNISISFLRRLTLSSQNLAALIMIIDDLQDFQHMPNRLTHGARQQNIVTAAWITWRCAKPSQLLSCIA